VKHSFSILALDTAYGEISACIISADQSRLTTAGAEPDNKTRSTQIIPVLDDLLMQAGLAWSDLDALAFSRGPGSFTGLRIAAATLAGINASLKLPMLHISSLAITAEQADSPDPIRVVEDARAGEAFVGLYQNGKAQQGDTNNLSPPMNKGKLIAAKIDPNDIYFVINTVTAHTTKAKPTAMGER